MNGLEPVSASTVLSIADIRREKTCIWKNVIVISTSFLLLLMSYTSLVMLQSSLNAKDGLGTSSLIAMNVGLVLSSLFLVSYVIDRLTPKWTIVVCELCYLGYTVAQFNPTFWTMLPTAFLMGLAAAPVWSAQCKYISVLGKRYSHLCRLQKGAPSGLTITISVVDFDHLEGKQDADGEDGITEVASSNGHSSNGSTNGHLKPIVEHKPKMIEFEEADEKEVQKERKTAEENYDKDQSMVMLFFGIFFATFQSAGIWGNMITSVVLSSGEEWGGVDNHTDQVGSCGVNFCEDLVDDIENLQRPEEWKIRIMLSIFVACTLSAALPVIVFLDPISRFKSLSTDDDESAKLSGCSLALSSLKQMMDPRQALISVLVFYSGAYQGFFDADFTKAFVGCAWGISKIGYVLMAAEATNSIGSVISGRLVKYTGRFPVFLGAFLMNIAGIIHMLLWDPKPGHEYVLFIMAVVMMAAEAVWQTHISGLHGVLFPDNMEAAFGVYKVWEGLGFMTAFFVNPLVCTDIKLYGMLVWLGIGFTCYCVLEYMESKRPHGETIKTRQKSVRVTRTSSITSCHSHRQVRF